MFSVLSAWINMLANGFSDEERPPEADASEAPGRKCSSRFGAK
jgi:hypothetical protein